jgi:hypothetical protein
MKPLSFSEKFYLNAGRYRRVTCCRYDNGYDMTAADLTKRYADLQQVD